ncbi:hypothetical protein MUG91_G58n81 [Manis pentadactyla]|nr:hypothetical protein MUG91_G58n81 [Manis pentadactyla]
MLLPRAGLELETGRGGGGARGLCSGLGGAPALAPPRVAGLPNRLAAGCATSSARGHCRGRCPREPGAILPHRRLGSGDGDNRKPVNTGCL